jgi:PleD family two-component response regulator
MAKSDMTVRLFSALEVANICGFKNQTAINWIKRGNIKAFITPGGQYRVYPEDLIAFMTSRNMRIPAELLNLSSEPQVQKILIIDDAETRSSQIKKALTENFPGFIVLQAFDGFEAGKLLVEEKPGLVILDIDLPGFDGYKLCKKIKTLLNSNIPKILIMTETPGKQISRATPENGVDAFLPKPLNFGELVSIVSAFTASRQQTK